MIVRTNQLFNFEYSFLHFFKEISQIKRKEALQAHTSQQVCYVQPLEVG